MNLLQELNKRGSKPAKGFTLVELLLVIALMAMVAGFSTPFYARFLTQNSVSTVRDQLTSHLRRAQMNAMMGKNDGPWGVTFVSPKLILFQGASYATRITALDESFIVNPSISISGLNELIYTKTTGLPNTSTSIVISGTGSVKTISVSNQGVVQQ